MRADRLISILMLLEKHGRMTARKLAAELEVSERTIYRDVDALSYAGVPLFTERGPGGGIKLLEPYRSDLTGLNRAEIRALLIMGVPAHLFELGIVQDFKSAVRKLIVAVPQNMEQDHERSKRVLVDPEPWDDAVSSTPLLHIVQQAVWEERLLTVTYYSELGPRVGTLVSTIQPYGLVTKDGQWYLVGYREDHMIVITLDRLLAAEVQPVKFPFPANFSLSEFWQAWISSRKASIPKFEATVEIADELLPFLEKLQSLRALPANPPGLTDSPQGDVYKISFSTFEEARSEILKFGAGMKVLGPRSLRLSVEDFANQTAKLYSDMSSPEHFLFNLS